MEIFFDVWFGVCFGVKESLKESESLYGVKGFKRMRLFKRRKSF